MTFKENAKESKLIKSFKYNSCLYVFWTEELFQQSVCYVGSLADHNLNSIKQPHVLVK